MTGEQVYEAFRAATLRRHPDNKWASRTWAELTKHHQAGWNGLAWFVDENPEREYHASVLFRAFQYYLIPEAPLGQSEDATLSRSGHLWADLAAWLGDKRATNYVEAMGL